GRILVVRRARAPAHGLYTLPGGVVEVGETLEEAVRREVREETAMTIEPVALAGFREAIVRDGEGRGERHFLILCFASRWVVGGRAGPQRGARRGALARSGGAPNLADHGRPRGDRGGGVRASGGTTEHVTATGPQRTQHASGGIICLPCFCPVEPRQWWTSRSKPACWPTP